MIRLRTFTPVVLVAVAMLIVFIGAQTGNGFSATAGVNDPIRGGLMYDKWWAVLGIDPPAGEHPLYPPEGIRTGSTTFRCKECHGWDYKGADGAYAKGSHYTGIPGVYGSTMTPAEMFDLLKFDEGTVTNGHGFGAYGMADQDILDVVEFLQTLVIDTDLYIDGNAIFLGDEAQGEVNYTTGGAPSCIACHGPDGTWINFSGDPLDPEWLGTIASGNPWEFLHKGRIGQPASGMPSWLLGGGNDQGVADMGRYAQLNFPTGICASDLTGDGYVNTSDLLELFANWGICDN